MAPRDVGIDLIFSADAAAVDAVVATAPVTNKWRRGHYEVRLDEARPTHPSAHPGVLPIDASIVDTASSPLPTSR